MKLVLFIAVGYAARKLKVIPDGFDKMLSRFVLAIPLPCMIIDSFHLDFNMEDLLNCPTILGLAVLSLIVSFLIAQPIYIKMRRTGIAKATRFALMFTNFTFFGLAVVSELYGAQGVCYYVIFTLPVRVVFYGAAPMMLGEKGQHPGVKATIKQFLCEPVVAVFIGFFLYVTQLKLPVVVSSVLSGLGDMASPLGLMLCGTIIADAQWKGILKYHCVLWVTALRLLALPAVLIGLFMLLGGEKEIIQSTVYCYAMPVASFLPTFLLRYNPNDVEARTAGGYMVIVSTLVCVATVPLWAVILEHI